MTKTDRHSVFDAGAGGAAPGYLATDSVATLLSRMRWTAVPPEPSSEFLARIEADALALQPERAIRIRTSFRILDRVRQQCEAFFDRGWSVWPASGALLASFAFALMVTRSADIAPERSAPHTAVSLVDSAGDDTEGLGDIFDVLALTEAFPGQ